MGARARSARLRPQLLYVSLRLVASWMAATSGLSFENDIPHSDSYFRAAREGMFISGTTGAHGKVKSEFAAFANEFFGRIEL